MSEIRAIETVYNGYRFRSRLEARWAVFFDTLGVRYEYEPEGYRVNRSGLHYLPDFYIPSWDKFVEIKPWLETEGKIISPKWIDLIQHGGKAMLAIFGSPYPGDYFSRLIIPVGKCGPHPQALDIGNDGVLAIGDSGNIYWTMFDALTANHSDTTHHHSALFLPLVTTVYGSEDATRYLTTDPPESHDKIIDDLRGGVWWVPNYEQWGVESFLKSDNLLAKAYIAARQARFEFGETPIANTR